MAQDTKVIARSSASTNHEAVNEVIYSEVELLFDLLSDDTFIHEVYTRLGHRRHITRAKIREVTIRLMAVRLCGLVNEIRESRKQPH